MEIHWFDRVENYLADLKTLATEIDVVISVMRVDTTDFNAGEVQRSNADVMEMLSLLETKVAERELLLNAEDAPADGVTLTEKIERSSHEERAVIAARCHHVSQELAKVNQKAVSLFVCQFHLAQLSGDIIRLIAKQNEPPTYQSPSQGEKKGTLGGGLFNEAA